jgi:predicted nucleotidyltransferase
MIPTLETIIKASGIHPSRVFNVTIFGSQVYGTSNSDSDWDIIMVANNSVEATELCGLKKGIYNIHVYSPNKFQEDLDWHRINNLECIWAPDWAKLKETIKYDFELNLAKLRHATSHISSNSWVKSRKKLEQDDYYIGVKSLFHSLRIPMFANQIATSGRITDFSCANFIWNKIKSKRWTWEELDTEFRELRNEILTDFRKVAEK